MDYDFIDEKPQSSIDILSIDPFLASVWNGENYGVVKKFRLNQRVKCYCVICTSQHCNHTELFEEWTKENGTEEIFTEEMCTENNNEETEITSISFNKIPYPLPENLRLLHNAYEAGTKTFPTNLVPAYDIQQTCTHGNAYSSENPISAGWVISDDVIVHKSSSSVMLPERKLFYRKAIGCYCKLYYDGQEDLLFNLDNHHLFYYDMLFHYLHIMIEGRNPLAAFQRSLCRNHDNLDISKTLSLKLLRAAWYSFSRLLDLHFGEIFQCAICKHLPDVVVCDGTSLGFRKDFLPTILCEPVIKSLPVIHGSMHNDRVFIRTVQGRRLLLQYSGYSKDRKKLTAPKPLTTNEFKSLVTIIQKDSSALAKIIISFSKSIPYTAPASYAELLSELARNSPVCGSFQYCNNKKLLEILKCVQRDQICLADSSNHFELGILQQYVPLLASFLSRCCRENENHIPSLVQALIGDIIERMIAPNTMPQPSSSHYLPPQEDSLSFFPNLPALVGEGNYAADHCTTKCTSDECHKYPGFHPVLTPGIFTIYCHHGICYGFQVMDSHESPCYPFKIFRSRFKSAPKLIIYDNACKLHQYCLNREPAFFSHTQFSVDRFHWKGHVGCSSGYNLAIYKSALTNTINSQVNEQANAGLQHIKSQVAYMSHANFMHTVSLFLAIKNLDVTKKLQDDHPSI